MLNRTMSLIAAFICLMTATSNVLRGNSDSAGIWLGVSLAFLILGRVSDGDG